MVTMSNSRDRAIERGLAQLEDYRKGKTEGFRVSEVIPPPIDVHEVRAKLGLTQKEFSVRYGIPLRTLQDWEQGRLAPETGVLMYLRLIAYHPKEMAKLLADSGISDLPG